MYAGPVNAEKMMEEKKENPTRENPPMVGRNQKGKGLGAICSGGLRILRVKMKRKMLLRRIKGVTIKEITPHHPRSIVLPVRFQK